MKKKILVGMGAFFCVAFAGIAQEVPNHTLDDFKLGRNVTGDRVTLSKLENKVVAIEYWGIT